MSKRMYIKKLIIDGKERKPGVKQMKTFNTYARVAMRGLLEGQTAVVEVQSNDNADKRWETIGYGDVTRTGFQSYRHPKPNGLRAQP